MDIQDGALLLNRLERGNRAVEGLGETRRYLDEAPEQECRKVTAEHPAQRRLGLGIVMGLLQLAQQSLLFGRGLLLFLEHLARCSLQRLDGQTLDEDLRKP